MTGFVVGADSASALVREVLSILSQEGEQPPWDQVAPRGMATRELRDCVYVLNDVSKCAAWLPKRNLNYAFMVAEFLWMFCGRDDVEMIGHYNKEVAKFSDDGKTFWGAYGARWREQIGAALHRLLTDHTTRQAVVTTWRPEYNEITPAGEFVDTKDVPCTVCMQYILRNGRLSASVYMRSSDAWLGLPYDVFNFASLQRAVAGELNAQAGPLTVHIGSSHVYERDLPRIREVLEASKDMSRGDAWRAHDCSVPPPPDLRHRWVMEAEEKIRLEGAITDLSDERWVDWHPYLSAIGFRNHRDHNKVVGPFAELVRP